MARERSRSPIRGGGGGGGGGSDIPEEGLKLYIGNMSWYVFRFSSEIWLIIFQVR